jgi:hypothetical protein
MIAQNKMNGYTYTLDDRTYKEGWMNLKLQKTKAGRIPSSEKRVWHLAWNGERLARNTDAGKLAKDDPEIYQWVVDMLTPITPDLIAEG